MVKEGLLEKFPKTREPPRILYGPIPYNLLEERLRCYGRDKGGVLFDNMSMAGGFAIKMAAVSDDIASVLVVDTKRINNSLKFDRKYKWWTTSYLEMNSFYCVQLQETSDEVKTNQENFNNKLRDFVEEMTYWTEIIQALSDSQLMHYNKWRFTKLMV